MSVYTFGDKIPSGLDTDLFVAYKVEGVPGGLLSGPYRDPVFANSEFDDIKTYDNVTDVKLVTRAEIRGT